MGMKILNTLIQDHFDNNMAGKPLFVVDVNGRDISDVYLSSFSGENSATFRDPQSSDKNCNHCKNFIRRYGNIVAIAEDLSLVTLFDVAADDEYADSLQAMSNLVSSGTIIAPFIEDFTELNALPYESVKKNQELFALGVKYNAKVYTESEAMAYPGTVVAGKAYEFNHMAISVPSQYINFTKKSKATLIGSVRGDKDVFMRGMEELRLDSVELVRDLAVQGSLLDIDAHLSKVEAFIPLMTAYQDVPTSQKDNWCWLQSANHWNPRFKGDLIGTLCSELSEGMEINKAVQNWNKRVDPVNYMKAVAPITKAQVQMAQKFVEENGYTESFDRRFANIDDVSTYIEEVLHLNVGDGVVSKVTMFDAIPTAKKSSHSRNKFDGVEEISIDKFMEKVLPTAKSVEVFFENRHVGNLSALFCPNVVDSKPIFKYPNNFSVTNIGNIAGKSSLAEMVSAKGGRTDGAFRFTHSWNELEPNKSLMDLHVFMPGCQVPFSGGGPNVSGRRVGWNNRTDNLSGGVQDVDYTLEAPKGYIPVENITFPNIDKMPNGVYTCKIHNWSYRNSGGRGKAEIAFGNECFQYEYPATKNHEWITVAEVTLHNGLFTIDHKLEPTNGSKEVWNIETNEFHKVNLLCHTPNHWGNSEVGNKGFMFFLDKCKADKSLRTFHNVDLVSELQEHRKVLDVLGNTQMVSPDQNKKQLCGLSFNSTVSDDVVVRVKGSHQRLLKIKF